MIRINLLGQARPKATGRQVPVESTMQILFFVLAVAIAGVVLFTIYVRENRELDDVNRRISTLQGEKSRLQAIKVEVDQFEREKGVLQERINVIENLQKNRTGGQELLTMLANTVVRTDTLWLTDLSRKGDALEITGQAGSINSVANLLTQMKRTGYFDKVEIKDAKETDVIPGVPTFSFEMSAQVSGQAATQGAAPGSTPSGTAAPARGRS